MRDSGLDDDVFVALTHAERRPLAPVGQLEPGGAGPAVPRHRDDRQLRRRAAMDVQEEAAARRPDPATLGAQWGAEPQDRWGRVYRGAGAATRPTAAAWHTFYPAFAAAVRGTGPVPVDPRDAVATATVLDAARTSAERRELVTLI